MKKKLLKESAVVGFTIIAMLSAKSQQQSIFNTYYTDIMQINVAAMGISCFEANLNYRSQSLQLNGAPKLYQLDANLALGKKQAVGVKVYQSNAGLLTFNTITGAYAYKLKINENTKIHFGLGVSYQQTFFNAQKAIVANPEDVNLQTDGAAVRANNFDCEAGLMLISKKFSSGISVNHLYNTNSKVGNTAFNAKQDFNLHASYIINANNNFEITPWLLCRYTLDSYVNPEVLVNVRFKKTLSLGAGYRLPNALIANLGVEISKLKIFYSFGYDFQEVSKIFGTSHQILLGFDLCQKKNKAEPEIKN